MFQQTAASVADADMLVFLAAVVLAAPSSGENPGVQVSLSTKALQYGKAEARLGPLGRPYGAPRGEFWCALGARYTRGCGLDRGAGGRRLRSRHQRSNVHHI